MRLALYRILFLGLPIVATFLYYRLVKKMTAEKIESPPVLGLLIVFSVWTCWTILMGGSWLVGWSALSSAVTILLMFATPIPMAWTAFINYQSRQTSKYHKWTFIAGLAYCLLGATILIYARIG